MTNNETRKTGAFWKDMKTTNCFLKSPCKFHDYNFLSLRFLKNPHFTLASGFRRGSDIFACKQLTCKFRIRIWASSKFSFRFRICICIFCRTSSRSFSACFAHARVWASCLSRSETWFWVDFRTISHRSLMRVTWRALSSRTDSNWVSSCAISCSFSSAKRLFSSAVSRIWSEISKIQ